MDEITAADGFLPRLGDCMTLGEMIKELTADEKKKRTDRNERLKETLTNSYANTFVKSVEKAANRKFCGGNISRIELVPILNMIDEILIFDKDGNQIENKKIEAEIRKYWAMKKKALDSNSDRRFKERKKINHTENLLNRCIGEEKIFNY